MKCVPAVFLCPIFLENISPSSVLPVLQVLDTVREHKIPVPGPVRSPDPELAEDLFGQIQAADFPDVCCTAFLNVLAPVSGIHEPADPDDAGAALVMDDEMDRQARWPGPGPELTSSGNYIPE